jgi:hypothetical protein
MAGSGPGALAADPLDPSPTAGMWGSATARRTMRQGDFATESELCTTVLLIQMRTRTMGLPLGSSLLGGHLDASASDALDPRTRSRNKVDVVDRVARAGVEPATFHFSGERYYQLSYLAVVRAVRP